MSFSGAQKAIVLLILSVLGAGQCCAGVVSVDIYGWVTEVDDRNGVLGGQIAIDDFVSGNYIYDSGVSDNNPSALIGNYRYDSAPFGLSLNINDLVFESNPQELDLLIEIYNDYDLKDRYFISSANNQALSNGAAVDQILWQLVDEQGTVLSSDSLISPSPISGGWEINNFRITCGRASIRGIITQAESHNVPEPATVAILGMGAIMAGLSRRRR